MPRATRALSAAACVAVVAGLLLLAPPALAANPFRFEPQPLTCPQTGSDRCYEIFATRVHLQATLIDESKAPFEWHAEVAAEESGHAPPGDLETNPAAWRPAGGYTESDSSHLSDIQDFPLGQGQPGNGDTAILRHLTPATSYFARFHARAETGAEAEVTFEFTTTAIAKPEFAFSYGDVGPGGLGGKLDCSSTSSASASCTASIQTNGASTEYHYEYTTEPANPASWAPFTEGATGAVTVAADFAQTEAKLTGLTPEATYYARLQATNAKGTAEETNSFTVPTAKPNALLGLPPFRNVTATSAHLAGRVLPHGFATQWRFESAPAEAGGQAPPANSPAWAPVPGAAGTVSQAEAEALPYSNSAPDTEGKLSGLDPATLYYVRLFAENTNGNSTSQPPQSFETSGPPTATAFATHALHGESLRLLGAVNPHSIPTSAEQTIAIQGVPTGGTFNLSFDGATTATTTAGATTAGSPAIAAIPLPPVKGTGNVIHKPAQGRVREVTDVTTSLGQFRSRQAISGPGIPPGDHIFFLEGTSLILQEPTTEAVSGAALTSAGPSPFSVGEAISGAGIPADTTITAVSYPSDFTGALTLSANATATATGVSLTAALPYNATAATVEAALESLPTVGELGVRVTGPAGGPYTVLFTGPEAEKVQPQIACDGSALTGGTAPTCTATTTQPGGEAYDTHARFEYVSQQQFAQTAWAAAGETPSEDLGTGDTTKFLGADLPTLTPGETYRYRIAATNTSSPLVVHGTEQALTVPDPTVEPQPPCPNQALRTGPSANLPDCRAYEQLTPLDKGATQELFNYGGSVGIEGALPAEDGNHLMYASAFVKWGSGPAAGQSPYFFSRDSAAGWQTTAATAQPEAGIFPSFPKLFDPALTQLGFEAGWRTSAKNESPTVEFKAGPPGGPYTTVASVPRKQVGSSANGWVAASADFSKLVLALEDRKLIDPQKSTGTKAGSDLYEYSQGRLRQLNVTGPAPGTTIGTCGATLAHAPAGSQSSRQALSADGSRVFFQAVPTGLPCSEPTHLYMRIDGAAADAQTLDIGPYRFVAADSPGTQLLLEKSLGETHEFFLYHTESASSEFLFSESKNEQPRLTVSADLSTVYLISRQQLTPEAPALSAELGGSRANLYRYDIAAKAPLRFIAQVGHPRLSEPIHSISSSPDGRYLYFQTGILGGLPGGGQWLPATHGSPEGQTFQVYRYDSAENVVQCVSCASPFDPEPRTSALFTESNSGGVASTVQPIPATTIASANGDYVFFDTASALLPADVDGEIAPEGAAVNGGEHGSSAYSLSSDVYQWRRPGLDGCTDPQGCLSLITSGRGGFLNILLGTTDSGRDVFFSTNESLLPRDNDTAADIYDARVGGGFPEPTFPVQCEGDACSHPVPAPNDPTPSSEQFHGAGNLTECPKGKVPKGGKCVARHHKKHHKAKKHHKRAANNNRGAGK